MVPMEMDGRFGLIDAGIMFRSWFVFFVAILFLLLKTS
jgi:hypothetical protein